MSFSIFLFLLNFHLITTIKDGNFTFITNEKNQIITEISIGTPSQKFNVILDTSSIFLMVFPTNTESKMDIKNKFNTSASSTFTEINEIITHYEYLNHNITPIAVNDTIHFANMEIKNFSFVLINNSNEIPDFDDIDGILGIGYKYEELNPFMNHFSLLEQLYVNNQITKKIYFINFTSESEGYVKFGRKNEQLLNENIGECIPPNNNINNMLIGKWQCVIKRIQIGRFMKNFTIYERETNNVDFLTFDTGSNFITVPEKFFDFITKPFKHYIENEICINETLKDKITYRRIKCKTNVSEIFYNKDIYFYVGDHIMIFPHQNMFSEIEGYLFFNMITYVNNTNEYEIGQILLKNFIIEFDKSKEIISFYSENYAIDTRNSKIKVLITFFILSLITLILTYIIYSIVINYGEEFIVDYNPINESINVNETFPNRDKLFETSKDTSLNASISNFENTESLCLVQGEHSKNNLILNNKN